MSLTSSTTSMGLSFDSQIRLPVLPPFFSRWVCWVSVISVGVCFSVVYGLISGFWVSRISVISGLISGFLGFGFLELPKIVVNGASLDMYNDLGRGRSNSSEGFGNRGYGSGQGSRNSGFGRSNGQFSGSSRDGYNRNKPGDFGRSGSFGESGRSDRSSTFGAFGSGRSSGKKNSSFIDPFEDSD